LLSKKGQAIFIVLITLILMVLNIAATAEKSINNYSFSRPDEIFYPVDNDEIVSISQKNDIYKNINTILDETLKGKVLGLKDDLDSFYKEKYILGFKYKSVKKMFIPKTYFSSGVFINIPDSIKNDRGMILDFKEGLLAYSQNKIYMALKSETIGEWLLIEGSPSLVQKFISSFDKNIMFRVYQNKDFDVYLIGNGSYLYKDKENFVIEIERGSEKDASFDFVFITNPFSKRSVYIAEKPDFEFSGRMVGQKLSTRSLKDSYVFNLKYKKWPPFIKDNQKIKAEMAFERIPIGIIAGKYLGNLNMRMSVFLMEKGEIKFIDPLKVPLIVRVVNPPILDLVRIWATQTFLYQLIFIAFITFIFGLLIIFKNKNKKGKP